MRIAVCISGEPRTFRHTHKSVRRYFHGHDIDFFLHTWKIDADTEHSLAEAYQPVSMLVENKPDFSDFYRKVLMTYGTEHFSFIYAADMFYGVNRAIKLKSLHETATDQVYDLVVRSRFDLLMGDLLDLDLTQVASMNAITVPSEGNFKGGYNDRFAMAPSHYMDLYADIYDWLPSSVDPSLYRYSDPGYHPEPVLGYYIDNVATVPVCTWSFEIKLLRQQYIRRPFVSVREAGRLHHHASKMPMLRRTMEQLGFKVDLQ